MTTFKTFNGMDTKEFNLCYDTPKDKYYLDICTNGNWEDAKTFYGDWALTEYLRDFYGFNDNQIYTLYSHTNQISY